MAGVTVTMVSLVASSSLVQVVVGGRTLELPDT